MVELLARPRYEIVPILGAEEAVLEHVPLEVKVTVTTSPRRGLEPTLALVERVAAHGYSVVPHLAARHVRDRAHLSEIVARVREPGVTDVLVMAGDAEEPVGEFDGALPLLGALEELGSPFTDVGITGYPESHAFLSGDAATKAMSEKAELATYIVTQVCFDPDATAAWMMTVWERGTRLPIHIGLPGVVPCAKLVRISERIGVGASIARLRDLEGEYEPDSLVAGLDDSLRPRPPNVAGFHIFTFNDLKSTERWRQRALGRLQPA